MSPTEALHIGRELLYHAMLLAVPAMALSLTVGLMISIFQAATSIQEQTLTFVPRILAVGILFLLTMPWMLKVSIYFATTMFATAARVGQ